jgi:hypothetical protein
MDVTGYVSMYRGIAEYAARRTRWRLALFLLPDLPYTLSR